MPLGQHGQQVQIHLGLCNVHDQDVKRYLRGLGRTGTAKSAIKIIRSNISKIEEREDRKHFVLMPGGNLTQNATRFDKREVSVYNGLANEKHSQKLR